MPLPIQQSKHYQPDKSTPNQPAADYLQQVLESFLTATSDAVYRMSADWRQMHQLSGKSFLLDTATTNSSWLQQYIPPPDQQQLQTIIEEAIVAKKPFELEHRVIRADGSLGWTFRGPFRFSTSRVKLRNGLAPPVILPAQNRPKKP